MQELRTATVDRTDRPVTVLQFGSGNFLRAFADWMLQQSNEAGLTNHGVAVVYATHRPGRTDPLAEQDGLYHVVLEGVKDGRQQRRVDLVDVVQTVVDPWEQHDAYQRIALSKELQLVISNTTEAGIVWREDALASTPASSFPGQLAQLLHDRFVAFDGAPEAGLHVLACELIEDNGETLRRLVVRHAEQAGWGEDFLAWLGSANHFYDTLVDRIVSGFPTDEAEGLWAETGFRDRAIVKGELFSLWVIGGDESLREVLPLDRLDLGVRLVPRSEVGPFRSKKVRVLNACHTAMAVLGLQLGFQTVDRGYGDAGLRAFLDEMIAEEVLPTIEGDRDELKAFAAAILERFDNPSLHHRLADISLNSVAKWKARNMPILLDRWAAGLPARRTVASLAALLALYSGHVAADGFTPRDEPGVVEAIAGAFRLDDLTGFVRSSLVVMGLDDLPDAERLVDETAEALEVLFAEGARALLAKARRA